MVYVKQNDHSFKYIPILSEITLVIRFHGSPLPVIWNGNGRRIESMWMCEFVNIFDSFVIILD